MSDAEKFEVDVAAIQQARDAFASGDWALCFSILSAFLHAKRRCGDDEWLEWAQRHMQRGARWYRDRLKEEILGSWKAGEFKDRTAMDERIEGRAISMMSHLGTALTYIWASQSRDACLEQLDGVPQGKGYIDWNTIASEALQQDVRDDLFEEHIMGDTEPLQVRNGWCDGCERWRPEREQFPLGEYVCDECSAP